jgi:hypothetical protein
MVDLDFNSFGASSLYTTISMIIKITPIINFDSVEK